MSEFRVCESPGCNAASNLQCPTCVKLGIQGSYFCTQDCFKSSWKTHKLLHKLVQGKDETLTNNSSSVYDPWPYFKFTGKLRPFPQSSTRTVPLQIPRPDYADHFKGHPVSEQKEKNNHQIKVLNDEEIEEMRVACKLGREVLDEAAKALSVGVTTDEVDRIVHEACVERNCYPSPLNYYQFPKSCCTSINEVICHGIPDHRPLQDGDICNVDVTVYHRGFHGDLNETFYIGDVKDSGKKLVNVTWECLSKAMDIVKPGEKYREIGNIIQKHAQANNFSVVRSYCGHGINQLFHTAPSVPHYAKNKAIGIMKPGHCFTIEPMISEGSWRDEMWPDNWTAVTVDGMLSAQFEHTLLVTDDGVEVLTQRPGNPLPHFLSP
ncbi:methionine aminopeptidase 1 [Neocloeon triangulifer]|uniref:methionine aminopeptidase 1 n=1 Tax=Neocloeon triangulifer TaxID=2078957 RepID=UPI00286EF007|nr:methionine aminopeptidase 1 [Neocloeon triangulifer]XP_059468315.1 methionine aminopeptidase 1 [Neocloeon triangulifer]